jgi:hypothetical protein
MPASADHALSPQKGICSSEFVSKLVKLFVQEISMIVNHNIFQYP